MGRPAILLTGGTGQVGTGVRMLADRFGVDVVAPGREALDLAAPASIAAAVGDRAWTAIINCAAYTAVDKAESDAEAAHAANAIAPGLLARAAGDVRLIHVSTDYVFDGAKPDPYVESDPVAALGAYGASKEAGERAVRAATDNHIILRTAWVVSPWGSNFVKTMLRLGRDRPELGVVADQIGNPTSALDIADALLTLATRDGPNGTYHFVNAGAASWYDLATAVFERTSFTPTVRAITTADYPTPARRPANSRLDTGKIGRDYGIAPRAWQAALDDIMADLLETETQ